MSRVMAGLCLVVIVGCIIFWLKALMEYDHPVPDDDEDWP